MIEKKLIEISATVSHFWRKVAPAGHTRSECDDDWNDATDVGFTLMLLLPPTSQ